MPRKVKVVMTVERPGYPKKGTVQEVSPERADRWVSRYHIAAYPEELKRKEKEKAVERAGGEERAPER